MSWLDFIASIVGDTIWPLVILMLATVFRREIVQAINGLRLSKLKIGKLEADFADDLDKAEQELRTVEGAVEIIDVAPSEKLLGYLKVDKKFAVLAAWMEIEQKLGELASIRHPDAMGDWPGLRNPMRTISVLNLPRNLRSALDDLRDARNKVAHWPDLDMSEEKIIRYLDIAADISGHLDGLISEAKS